MSVGATKNGYAYQKSNSCKILGAAIGGTIGAKVATVCKDGINDKIEQLSNKVTEGRIQELFNNVDTFVTGKDTIKGTWNTIKKSDKIYDLASKGLGFVKKHPVGIAVATGALALASVGSIFDNISNSIRAHQVEKKHK